MTARSAIVSERSSSGVSEARYLPRKYQERFERDAEARSKSGLVTGSTSAFRKAAARPVVVMMAATTHHGRDLASTGTDNDRPSVGIRLFLSYGSNETTHSR